MDKEEILSLAENSQIKLSEAEIEKFQKEFKEVQKYYEKLEQFETEGHEPMFSVLENIISNRFNDDIVFNTDREEYELMIDKEKMIDGFYQVPNKEGN